MIVSPRLARFIRRVTRPLYGGHEVDAITVGHTTFYLIPAPIPRDLERHEFEHVMQAIRAQPEWWPWWLGRRYVGVLIFWVTYLAEYARHGYNDNRFERRARIAAGQE